MNPNVWIIDAFTKQPFRGNPAGVCVLNEFLPDLEMQKIAMSVDLSETAFVVPISGNRFGLRWFTPETEVKLCGHATLAAAHVLRQGGMVKRGESIIFETQSGDLFAKTLENGVEINLPALPGSPVPPPAALKALGIEIIACEMNRDNYLVETRDLLAVTACAPDFKKLKKLACQGVIVTASKGAYGYDFASRYFAPSVGVDEDPVTGSAHCFLAPYWSQKLGKREFHALQASKAQGVLDVTLKGDRVIIAGPCVTTLKGKLPPQKNGTAA